MRNSHDAALPPKLVFSEVPGKQDRHRGSVPHARSRTGSVVVSAPYTRHDPLAQGAGLCRRVLSPGARSGTDRLFTRDLFAGRIRGPLRLGQGPRPVRWVNPRATPSRSPPTRSAFILDAPETDHEAYVSAQTPPPRAKPRVQAPDVDPSGPSDHQGSASQGKETAVGLSRRPGSIRDRSTFEALRRSGRRVRRGQVTLTYADVGPCRAPRVAYAVGRRTGGAVQRNRVRRRLRAIVRELADQLPPGAYLVAAAPGAAALSFWELRDMVQDCVRVITREVP